MAYCTLDDIKGLLNTEIIMQLTDDENAGAIVESRVIAAIVDADAEIDGYCGVRYTVPFSSVPALIKKLSVDIAIYNLYSRKVDEVPEARKDRYNAAIVKLKDISKGIVRLDATEEKTESSNEVISNKDDDDRIFTSDSMGGF
ncbi:MAG: DUF1320 domain-containing protein [Nitrospirae bacterium]|nr:MAG: DUF1320 domain-containing protein [Nitrospirota bacterium]